MEINDLMNAIWEWEDKQNKESYKMVRAKRILIHPKEFYELASDERAPGILHRHEDGISFAGIELIRTTDVETFKIE